MGQGAFLMTPELHRELVQDIDALMTKIREKVPKDFDISKAMIYQKLHEANHWLRDLFELHYEKSLPNGYNPTLKVQNAKSADDSTRQIKS